ncbi:hypothetical protein D3C73_1583410 [compost metagenome]
MAPMVSESPPKLAARWMVSAKEAESSSRYSTQRKVSTTNPLGEHMGSVPKPTA